MRVRSGRGACERGSTNCTSTRRYASSTRCGTVGRVSTCSSARGRLASEPSEDPDHGVIATLTRFALTRDHAASRTLVLLARPPRQRAELMFLFFMCPIVRRVCISIVRLTVFALLSTYLGGAYTVAMLYRHTVTEARSPQNVREHKRRQSPSRKAHMTYRADAVPSRNARSASQKLISKQRLLRPPKGAPMQLRAFSTSTNFTQYLNSHGIACTQMREGDQKPIMDFVRIMEDRDSNTQSTKELIEEYTNENYQGEDYHSFHVLLQVVKGDNVLGQVMLGAHDEDTDDDYWTMQGIIGRPREGVGTFLLETLRDNLDHKIRVRPIQSNPVWLCKLRRFSKRKDGSFWIFEPVVRPDLCDGLERLHMESI